MLGKLYGNGPWNRLSVRLRDSSLTKLVTTNFGIWPVKTFPDKSRKVKFLHSDINSGNSESKLFP
ncbi:hypothetical protein RchiOBHm_Chr0c16g0499751 [Rosa chinensis]|uniref:Uncharacterized protein n=1 Tax=Rosa chinensis TaxID=74649 RepID=A0A2P6SQP2_ROSCH|nr:hypothetical protein RchiOBHm_Chr0c16g0499751 [Rosa chinensis]